VGTQKSSIDDTFQRKDLLDWSFSQASLLFALLASTELPKETWKEGNGIVAFLKRSRIFLVYITNITAIY
jgi:hypothetical protein